MNWGKLLMQALEVGVALKSIADIDEWLDEKIGELRAGKHAEAYIEMAYEVAQMDNDAWQYLIGHLKVKALNNNNAEHIFQYCNFVVNLENTKVRELLSYSIADATEVLAYNLRGMEIHEAAAYYGVLKAYAQNNMKANAILNQYNRLLG